MNVYRCCWCEEPLDEYTESHVTDNSGKWHVRCWKEKEDAVGRLEEDD